MTAACLNKIYHHRVIIYHSNLCVFVLYVKFLAKAMLLSFKWTVVKKLMMELMHQI